MCRIEDMFGAIGNAEVVHIPVGPIISRRVLASFRSLFKVAYLPYAFARICGFAFLVTQKILLYRPTRSGVVANRLRINKLSRERE